MRYCIQLHIIMCKRKTLILMFFTSLLYNLKLRLYRIREKKIEHILFGEMFCSEIVHLSMIQCFSLLKYCP